MDISEVFGIIAYLAVLWVVCAAAAGTLLLAADASYRGVLRATEWLRSREAVRHEAGQPHPVRKHGRRIVTHGAPARTAVRHRVYPLV